ncbi:hypothetical protein ACVWZW_005784 [Bradyrhizobium sp. F1.13.4]
MCRRMYFPEFLRKNLDAFSRGGIKLLSATPQ